MRVRIVLKNSRTIEVKRCESKTRVILKEKTNEKKKDFPAKDDTVVEVCENDGIVSIKLRPVRGKVKEETMSF